MKLKFLKSSHFLIPLWHQARMVLVGLSLDSVHVITEPVLEIFKTSIRHYLLPKEWKICPVYKSGNKSDVANYRPISLLRILSMTLEKIVYQKILQFVSSKIFK